MENNELKHWCFIVAVIGGSILLILSILTVIGTLVSDILLVIVDPRIRYE